MTIVTAVIFIAFPVLVSLCADVAVVYIWIRAHLLV